MCPMYSVLYVDDEKQLLDLCRIYLEKTGDFTVETTDSVPAALKMYLKIVLQMFFNTLLESYVSVADLIQ